MGDCTRGAATRLRRTKALDKGLRTHGTHLCVSFARRCSGKMNGESSGSRKDASVGIDCRKRETVFAAVHWYCNRCATQGETEQMFM